MRLTGTWNYLAAARLTGVLRSGAAVTLIREPHNHHDENAIRVDLAANGSTLGHVPAPIAAAVAGLLDSGARYESAITAITEPPSDAGIDCSLSLRGRPRIRSDVTPGGGRNLCHRERSKREDVRWALKERRAQMEGTST